MNLAQIALLVVCFTFDIHRAVAEDVFIVTNKYCITNSTSAITFNTEVENTNPMNQPKTSFYPTIADASSQCDYEDECKNQREWMGDSDWSIINSIDGPINHIITDRRWEAFPLYKSFIEINQKTYLVSKINNGYSFEISVSIRAEQDGHIFLCNGTKPTDSWCYWILIGYNKGSQSGIRKCAANDIIENKIVPHGMSICKQVHNKKDTPAVLSKKAWTHFKIKKQNNKLVVWKGNEQLLYFEDTGYVITPNSLIIHSKKVEALWKIHEYHYLYTDKEGITSLGPPGSLTSQSCISMYIAMCKECSLTVRIALNEDLAKETFTTQNTEWKKIQIKYILTADGEPILYIARKVKSGRSGFWAIDDIRFCSENDYRFIKSSEENVPCEKIDIRKGQILNVKSEKVDVSNKPNIDCSEQMFGKFCVPCKIFNNKPYCEGFKYCENGDHETECRCTAGYMDQCEKDCPYDKYGHGCKKTCGSCEKNCNHVNGYCDPCLSSYTGSRCDIAPEPLLKDPPNVTFDGLWCKVRVENFETTTGERAKYFIIQYKSENNSNWTNSTGKLKLFNDTSEDFIYCLPDTTYEFRAVLMAESNSLIDPEVHRTSRKILTPCKGPEPDDIIIKVTNTTANVTFKREKFNCKLERYTCILSNDVTKRTSANVKFNGLEPYKSYNISCSDYEKKEGASKKFQTKEGVPSEVQNIRGTANSTQILLTWQEPSKTNGIIHHYDITYKLVQNKECKQSIENQATEVTSSETTKIINNLRPFSTYYVYVRAVTGAGPGEYNYATVDTAMSDDLSQTETMALEYVELQPNSDYVYVKLPEIDCKALEGHIYIRFRVSCSNAWCSSPTEQYETYTLGKTYFYLYQLFAFTNYTVNMLVSRNNMSWIDTSSEKFTTLPSVPRFLASTPTVYSRDEHSISLRWKPPYPPTGILTDYQLQYRKYTYHDISKTTVTAESCKIWRDYHCATIKKDKVIDQIYVQILARNENHPDFSAVSDEFWIQNIDAVPEPPYGLRGKWTENNLNISWYHPNNTNGELQDFKILIRNDLDTSKYNYTSIPINSENYNLTYTHSIPEINFTMCSNYRICVTATNQRGPSYWSGYILISTPPRISINISEMLDSIKGTENTINVPVYQLPQEERIAKTFYIFISDSADHNDLDNFETSLQNNQEHFSLMQSHMVFKAGQTNLLTYFEIGNQNSSDEHNQTFQNPPLQPGRNYSVTYIFLYKCNKGAKTKRVQKYVATRIDTAGGSKAPVSDDDSNGGLYALLLLLFVPILGLGYLYRKKKNGLISTIRRMQQSSALSDEIPIAPIAPVRVRNVKPKRVRPNSIAPLVTIHSKRIKLTDFESYVKESIETEELERQHNLFPRGLVHPCEYGSLQANKIKNRYKNLIAYDQTRVKLQKINGDQYSDYINANYIDGYRKPRAFIATQGPKKCTLDDFWRMIWQENVKHIIMLANVYENGKKKVEKYWPDINESTQFGDIKVSFVSSQTFANFDFRVFVVHRGNEERKVSQFHYTTWPDHGVPLYSQSLVPFLQHMLKIPYNTNSPIVVHCSAGVGRTGTIIISDICLRMAAIEGSIDFLAHLENLRNQRSNLVDNIEQYKLAHLVVLECLFGMRTAIPCNDEMKTIILSTLNNNGIKTQMKYILDTQWQDSAMESMLDRDEEPTIYHEKNRFKDIIPEKYRIYLTRYPVDDETSSYINAVPVDGFNSPGRYIVTQQPMRNTLGDFWRMVVERGCTVIINLNEIEPKDKKVCQFWPENGAAMSPVDYLLITHIKTRRLDCYKIITVQVQVNLIKEECLSVDIIAPNNWKHDELLPSSAEEFLSFWDASYAKSRNSDPVIVTCYNGATASGLYVAMSFLIEKMKLEQECDVCQAVRSIRHSRKQFVTSEEQYEFLYQASLMYIVGFQPYSNFS